MEIAVHAPSPHNVQPWRIRLVSDNEAELYIDSTRTLPKEDVTGSFIISTMGLFIEALDILAGDHDLHIEYDLITPPESIAPAILESETPRLIPFAKLHLVSEAWKTSYEPELFLRRRTSRLHLLDRAIRPESMEALRGISAEWHQNFAVTSDADQIERILKANTAALFADLNSPDYHDEIVEWFRFTEKQSLKHLDGLDARCMNTSPMNYWLIANVPKLLLLPIAKQLMARMYRAQLGRIPMLGILSGKFWKAEDAIEAGRFLMRFWLETARQNLYIHPFGNLVTNDIAAAAVEKDLGINDIWLIFKLGYSNEPPKSHRLPIDKILV